VSQNNAFILWVAFVKVFHHSNRKRN
jgi:hypothetical protein